MYLRRFVEFNDDIELQDKPTTKYVAHTITCDNVPFISIVKLVRDYRSQQEFIPRKNMCIPKSIFKQFADHFNKEKDTNSK